MLLAKKNITLRLFTGFLLTVTLLALAACSTVSTDVDHDEAREEADHEESEHNSHHEDAEPEHAHDARIPNEGVSIRILDPEDGVSYAEGDEVMVEVDVTGFALGEDGKHWHIYVDGTSWAMVVGGQTTEILSGLEPGERKIEVFLTGGDHVELQDGDSINIMID